MNLDDSTQYVIKKLYCLLRENDSISLSSPEYQRDQIDFIIKNGLLKKIDVSTMSGWCYIVSPTYEGRMLAKSIKPSKYIKISEFLDRAKIIKEKEYHPAPDGFPFSYIAGPLYDNWMNEINIFNDRFLKNHPLFTEIEKAYKLKDKDYDAFEKMVGYLTTLLNDEDFLNEEVEKMNNSSVDNNNKVFIVHGHDDAAKLEMARTLEKGGFEAIILHEQPDEGNTIIEKIEKYSDVAFAVVLYTECDIGRDKNFDENSNQYRARQNVVFEHGYLIGKLGRKNVCAFVKGDVETPGDISGVVYIPMDASDGWKIKLASNMNAVGLNFDLNSIV